MSVTLVTCFYPIRSKYPQEHYIHWARDFLSLEAQIVLFTEPHLANLFRSLHKGPINKLRIVELPFTQLDAWVLWKKEWVLQHALDPEKAIHSPELYAVWAQKPFFVNRVIEMNPFETEYFFWCDIGAFREGVDPVIQTSFPDSRHLLADRILMNSVVRLDPADRLRKPDGIKGSFLYMDRIVGGLWGGGRVGCLRWLAAYGTMIERYFAAGRFAGKDQSVMLSAYLEDTTLAHIVKPNINDGWFYATHLCSRKNIMCESDSSYTSVDPHIISVSLKGGLGNQLFQISRAYAHAKGCGAALQLPRQSVDDSNIYWLSVFHGMESYIADTDTDSLPHVSESYSDSNACLHEFSHIINELSALYMPSQEIIDTNMKKYCDLILKRDNVVVIDARQRDCLAGFEKPLPVSYYVRAIEAIMKDVRNPVFVLCSDDPLFWLEVIPHVPALQTYPFHILADDVVHTYALLRVFKYFVIANSAISWWSAWLSLAVKVYAPAHWFDRLGPHQCENMYNSAWNCI